MTRPSTEPPSREATTELLAKLADPRGVLEDFRPVALALEWQLGALHGCSAGVRPFVHNEVPYLINNDGMLSSLVASLLLANERERATSGAPNTVVEYGAGSLLRNRRLAPHRGGVGGDPAQRAALEPLIPLFEYETFEASHTSRRWSA